MMSALLGLALLCVVLGDTSAMVQVRVSDGVLEGELEHNEYGGSYFSFKGIPYAQPPLGDLRFKVIKVYLSLSIIFTLLISIVDFLYMCRLSQNPLSSNGLIVIISIVAGSPTSRAMGWGPQRQRIRSGLLSVRFVRGQRTCIRK